MEIYFLPFDSYPCRRLDECRSSIRFDFAFPNESTKFCDWGPFFFFIFSWGTSSSTRPLPPLSPPRVGPAGPASAISLQEYVTVFLSQTLTCYSQRLSRVTRSTLSIVRTDRR